MKDKKVRLEAIRSILQTEKIGNQEELIKKLNANGFTVTQATLSRDIKQLKIAKGLDEDGNYVYRLPDNPLSGQAKTETAVPPNIEFSGNLAVMKTRPGYAMGIAWDIDNTAPDEILATIAGDDTILIVPREGVSRERVIKALSPFLEQ